MQHRRDVAGCRAPAVVGAALDHAGDAEVGSSPRRRRARASARRLSRPIWISAVRSNAGVAVADLDLAGHGSAAGHRRRPPARRRIRRRRAAAATRASTTQLVARVGRDVEGRAARRRVPGIENAVPSGQHALRRASIAQLAERRARHSSRAIRRTPSRAPQGRGETLRQLASGDGRAAGSAGAGGTSPPSRPPCCARS